jgi:hypothetical protein
VAERYVSSRLQRIEERHVDNTHSVKGFNVSSEGSNRGLAACAKSITDREQLLSMSPFWLTRAQSEEWRDDLPPLPPVRSNALVRGH